MSDSNQTVTTNYDSSPLFDGLLFDGRSDKYAGILVGVLFAFAGAIIVFGPTKSRYTYPSAPLTLHDQVLKLLGFVVLIGFSLLATYMLLWVGFLRGWFYARSIKKFETLNQLQQDDSDRMLAQVPPSLRIPGEYNQKAVGFRFNVHGQRVTIFDYHFNTGIGKNRKSYDYSIASITFDKEYPQLYLDGKANGKNHIYDDGQEVALEGDFNKYFTLYMPAGSAAGALTLLSPDVMQTLIDQARQYDLEIAGYEVAVIAQGLSFTRNNFESLLTCSHAVSREFAQLNISWQPTLMPTGQQFTLRRHNAWIGFAVFCTFIVLRIAYNFF